LCLHHAVNIDFWQYKIEVDHLSQNLLYFGKSHSSGVTNKTDPFKITTSIFSKKISPANDGLFVLDGLFVHEGLYVYVQLTYKKAWIF